MRTEHSLIIDGLVSTGCDLFISPIDIVSQDWFGEPGCRNLLNVRYCDWGGLSNLFGLVINVGLGDGCEILCGEFLMG